MKYIFIILCSTLSTLSAQTPVVSDCNPHDSYTFDFVSKGHVRFVGLVGTKDTTEMDYQHYLQPGLKRMAIITPMGDLTSTAIMDFVDSVVVSLVDMVINGDSSKTGVCTKISAVQPSPVNFSIGDFFDTTLVNSLKPTKESKTVMGFACKKHVAENAKGTMVAWITSSEESAEIIDLVNNQIAGTKGKVLHYIYTSKTDSKVLDYMMTDFSTKHTVISTSGYTFY